MALLNKNDILVGAAAAAATLRGKLETYFPITAIVEWFHSGSTITKLAGKCTQQLHRIVANKTIAVTVARMSKEQENPIFLLKKQ